MLSRNYKLEHISNAAQRIKVSAFSALSKAGKEPSLEPHLTSIQIPHLSLPIPDDIASLLLSKRCPLAAARSLSDAYLRSAHQIRDMYQSSYSQTYTRLSRSLSADSPHLASQLQRLGSFLEQQYRDKIIAVERLAIDQVEASQKSKRTVQTAKTVFNQEFVPLLEKYFEYNAYPSAPDRAALARKSMMTARQIEFQNHRNRAKKEGKALRKLTLDPLPLKLSLESLEKKMPFFIIPEAERVDPTRTSSLQPASEDDSDDEGLASKTSTQLREASSFSETAPHHAFPMIYPPTCNYDPFPVKTGKFSFPEPAWARKPTTIRRRPKVALDMEDFIFDFSMKLVIRESASRKQQRKSATCGSAPWYAATHTTAPSAPLLSLVRVPRIDRVLSTFAAPLPTVSAPSSRLHPFRSPSPMSHPESLMSVAQTLSQSSNIRKKVSRLPRRIPKHTSLCHRGISPAASDSSFSPSPSRSFSSRTSSFSSDTSDCRHSSSSGSSSSSSSPTTPVLSATSLPEDALSPPVSVSGLDFPHDDGLFDDSLHDFSHLNRLRDGHNKPLFNIDAITPRPTHPHCAMT